MKLYKILEKTLILIEENLKENLVADDYSKILNISTVHLRRIFKSSFGITLSSYIRSRKLSESLEMLSNSSFTILDVALEYNFGHAQSYTRAFRNEFGITPAEFKKSKRILKIKPPIKLFNENNIDGSLLFGPEIVYINEFQITGKKHIIPNSSGDELAAGVAHNFWLYDKDKVMYKEVPYVYIGLTKNSDTFLDYTEYYTSVLTSKNSKRQGDFYKNIIPSGLYIKFKFIGEGHPIENGFNASVADAMYNAIDKFEEENIGYTLYNENESIYFERISEEDYDGTYFVMEWFTPVYEK